jgi:hypothetical protein
MNNSHFYDDNYCDLTLTDDSCIVRSTAKDTWRRVELNTVQQVIFCAIARDGRFKNRPNGLCEGVAASNGPWRRKKNVFRGTKALL